MFHSFIYLLILSFTLQHKGIEIWSRPITPIFQTYYSYAIAFVNRRTDGTPSDVAVTLRELGLVSPTGYRVEVKKYSSNLLEFIIELFLTYESIFLLKHSFVCIYHMYISYV